MCLHTIIDLSSVLHCPPEKPFDRLPSDELASLRSRMQEKGFLGLPETAELEKRLAQLRSQYEPYIQPLAERFHLAIPPWVHTPEKKKN